MAALRRIAVALITAPAVAAWLAAQPHPDGTSGPAAFSRGVAQAPAADPVGTSKGVYTAAQATRGEDTYMNLCVACHPAGTYTTPAFREKWNGQLVADLFALVSETMPKQEPASLTPKEYADIVAYLLKINEAPAGKEDLPADAAALKKIKIEMPVEKKSAVARRNRRGAVSTPAVPFYHRRTR
jgi:mono/diheme cytochrome c family protein